MELTNRQRFFMNGILLTAVGVAIRSVTLVFNSFITQSIGAVGIGLFTLIGTVYSFAVTFATSGISLTVTRLVSAAIGEGREREVGGILRSSVLYSLAFSLTATAVLFLGAPYFGGILLSDVRTVIPLRILAISLLPIALSSVFSGYFVGVKRVGKNAVVQVLGQVFKISITALFIFNYARLGVAEGIVALAISMSLTEFGIFLVALLQFILDRRSPGGAGNAEKRHMPAVAGMALPLAFSAYIRSALLTVEHALIPKRLRDSGASHTDALASYGILHGMALPMLLYPMATLTSFASLLVPEFSESLARGEHRRMRRIASEALNTTLAYSLAAMVLLSFFSEELGCVVYGSAEAGKYIALMAPVIPIMYLDHVSDSMLKGIGEHVYSMWVNISDSFLSIILVWLLIPRLGIAGYAVVIVVMEGYNFILSVIRLRSRIKFELSPLRYIVFPLIAAALSAAVSKKAFAERGSTTSPLWLFLEIAFSVCIFLAVYLSLSMGLKKIYKAKKTIDCSVK